MIDVRISVMERLLQAKNNSESVIIYPHTGADGDALGSSLSLLLALRKIGIKTELLIDEPISPKLKFIPAYDLAEVYDENKSSHWEEYQTIALAVDCADADRTGRRGELFEKAPVQMALDHHVSSGESSELRLIDSQAAATAEIISDLIVDFEKRMNINLMDTDIASLLMTAIISDTGGFVYSNTTARTFSTAAFLMSYKPDIRQITYQLFDLSSQTKLRLTGRIFSDAQFHFAGRLAIAIVDQKLLREYSAAEHDLEGIVSQLRNVAGVEVSFMLRELDDKRIRVNIRSSDGFNASEFASLYNGGGHPKAAGMTLQGFSLQEAADMLIGEAERYLP